MIEPTPNPPDAVSSQLSGVSCASANACAAVGFYFTDFNTSPPTGATLAESWDGTAWTIQPTPNPADAGYAVLSGVSCTSASACTAVGVDYLSGFDGGSRTLAERWDGTSWTIQPTAEPPDATYSQLSGVSCTSASACTAVGSYYLKSSDVWLTLAERWNGTTWKIQPTQNIPSADTSGLNGVSCTSANACTAVGSYHGNLGASNTLAERWNGITWKIQPTFVSGQPDSGLSGVSCTSGLTTYGCTALGFLGGPNVGFFPLAVRWNGLAWAVQPTATTNRAGSLSGVSCTPDLPLGACTGVGGYQQGSDPPLPLVETWRGTTWKVEPTPNPPIPGSFLNGVSCTSAGACTAVGLAGNSTGPVTLAERHP